MIYFLLVISNTKNPNTVDNNEPDKTPILTPSIYWVFSTNAKFPTNKLIVNPIPVKMLTPYKFNQLALLGISAIFSLIETKENNRTPSCFPKKRPNKIPNGTGVKSEEKLIPSNETPALARANKGIIPKATYVLILCSIFVSNEKSFSFFLCGIIVANKTPAIVA